MPKFKELLRVAIVEDDDSYAETLQEYLNKYEQENEVRFQVVRYEDGADLVEKYHGDFDILIMDIELKFMDGMTAAQHIRKMDSNVIIIFVTNMPQFALKGYQVDALDYVLKPISYYAFSQRLERALERMERRSAKKYITLHLKGMNRSPSSRQLKKYKFFLPAEIYLLAVFMRLASKFRVFPLVLKFRDSFVSVYCYSNLYNLRSFLREYLYQ